LVFNIDKRKIPKYCKGKIFNNNEMTKWRTMHNACMYINNDMANIN